MNTWTLDVSIDCSLTSDIFSCLFSHAADLDNHSQQADAEDLKDIQGTLNNDSSAFDRLIARYERKVTTQMWRYTHDPVMLEELVQDVFVKAYIGLSSFKGKSPFLHWLRVIATRVGYAFWKEQKRKKAFPMVSLDEVLDMYGHITDEDAVDAAAAGNIIQAVLKELSPKNRMVLTLQYLENSSIREIAERMGWSLAGTKMQAMRARKKLKKLIQKNNLMEKFGWMK